MSIKCLICGREFKNLAGLSGHIQFKHPEHFIGKSEGDHRNISVTRTRNELFDDITHDHPITKDVIKENLAITPARATPLHKKIFEDPKLIRLRKNHAELEDEITDLRRKLASFDRVTESTRKTDPQLYPRVYDISPSNETFIKNQGTEGERPSHLPPLPPLPELPLPPFVEAIGDKMKELNKRVLF